MMTDLPTSNLNNLANSPKISVVMPIYNAQDYLCKSIDSVLKQSFTDFELVLVNDGSVDRSLEICCQYANLDSRIKVIDKKNEGVSVARNCGIKEVIRAGGGISLFLIQMMSLRRTFWKRRTNLPSSLMRK